MSDHWQQPIDEDDEEFVKDDTADPIPLIQQFLFEHGFHGTLKLFEQESNRQFYVNALKLGSRLETILNDYRELQLATATDHLNLDEKQSDDKLLERGAGDFVKSLQTSLDSTHKANVLCVSFSHHPGTPFVASGSTDKTVKITNYQTGEIVSEYSPHTGAVLSVDFNPKYHHLLLSSAMDGTHAITDTEQKKVLQTFKDHSKYVVAVRWYHDGLTFATASHDRSVNLYRSSDVTSDAFTLVEKFPFHTNPETIAFNKSGSLVVGVREDNYLHIIDINTSSRTKFNMNANLDDHVSFTAMHISFSPKNQEYILVSTDRDRVIMYRLGNSTPVRNFYGCSNDSFGHPRNCWHPDEKYVYSNSQDNRVYCWDISTQKIVQKLEGHTAAIRDLLAHPYENIVASCGFDKTIKIWKP